MTTLDDLIKVGDTVTIKALAWKAGPNGLYKADTQCVVISIDNHTPQNIHKYCLKHDGGWYYTNDCN